MKKTLYVTLTLIVIAGLTYLFTVGVTVKNNIRAARGEKIGELYIGKVYQEYTVLGKICQGVDTDANGYISCTFRISKNTIEKEINLQCPTYIRSFMGNDCKASQMILQQ